MMNKEKEFNNILDECLDRLLFGGETPEECLRKYPELADDLRPLLETAFLTRHVSEIEARPEFRNKARTEFSSVIKGAAIKRNGSFFRFGWQRSFISVTAIVLILLLATGGTVAASLGSMPNDFLYPLKRATEQVQLAFTFTSLGKAEAYARMADKRVEEIIYLANEDEPEEIIALANSINSNLMNVAALSSRQQNSAVRSESDASMQFSVMSASEESITPESAADSGEAIMPVPETVESVFKEVTPPAANITDENDKASGSTEVEPVGDTGTLAAKSIAVAEEAVTPTSKSTGSGQEQVNYSQRELLNTTVVNQANSNISRLRKLLETVPESARAAIEKAIELSEQGYEIAIDSLD